VKLPKATEDKLVR
jgi:hypothetical protein